MIDVVLDILFRGPPPFIRINMRAALAFSSLERTKLGLTGNPPVGSLARNSCAPCILAR